MRPVSNPVINHINIQRAQPPKSAPLVIHLTMEELTKRSDMVIVGTPTNLDSYWQDNVLYTRYHVRVDKKVIGWSVNSCRVLVRGGTVAGGGQTAGEGPNQGPSGERPVSRW